MKEISQEDFENRIQDILDGKLTRGQLAKDLVTDTRTLNNKIQELSVYNMPLYIAFIQKYPYKSKERDDIDYEALIIEIIKKGMTTADAVSKYKIGERTIRRKVKELEKDNPYLIEIYTEVKRCIRNNLAITRDLEEKISQLVERPVKIGDINATRKKQLEDLEATFNSRCQYVSKEEAAQSMGLTANRMYKLLNELYRIKIEETHKKKIEDGKLAFKDALKVNSSETTIKPITNEQEITPKTNTGVLLEGEVK